MKTRTDIRIYNKGEDDVKESLYNRKWQVKADEALEDALHRWNECLVGGENGLCRHEIVVDRRDEEVVWR